MASKNSRTQAKSKTVRFHCSQVFATVYWWKKSFAAVRGCLPINQSIRPLGFSYPSYSPWSISSSCQKPKLQQSSKIRCEWSWIRKISYRSILKGIGSFSFVRYNRSLGFPPQSLLSPPSTQKTCNKKTRTIQKWERPLG